MYCDVWLLASRSVRHQALNRAMYPLNKLIGRYTGTDAQHN